MNIETSVKYPDVFVQLSGRDGNAYAILGAVRSALRRAGVSREEQDAFIEEATAGDYNMLLAVCMSWVEVG
jgi:hypothetical protein